MNDQFEFDGLDDEFIEVVGFWALWRRKNKKRKKRVYVDELNLSRNDNGTFATLVREMRDDHPEHHFNYFRMSKYRFDQLLRLVGPKITHAGNHRLPISPSHRLALTLRFLCDGGSLEDKAYQYRLNSYTYSNIVKETTAAIWEVLRADYLTPPDRTRWQEIATEFWIRWNFPLALGAVDGKHVEIRAPPNSGSTFYNYKQYFSIVLLAMVDAKYNFIFIDVGGAGREGDAGLFGRSSFGQRMDDPTRTYENGGLNIPFDACIPGTNIRSPHVFLGDEAFKLRRHLMKPYRRQTAGGGERTFNFRLSTARRVVENAFGVMGARFRVLDGKINLGPALVDNIIKACVCLHNYLKFHDANDYTEPRYVPTNFVDYENANNEFVPGQWRREIGQDHQYARLADEVDENPARVAYDVRERLKNFFLSDTGKVPWQDHYVREGLY